MKLCFVIYVLVLSIISYQHLLPFLMKFYNKLQFKHSIKLTLDLVKQDQS